jgi:hypothetical protein
MHRAHPILIFAALAIASPSLAKGPFEFTCSGEADLKVTYCCPEQPSVAAKTAHLIAAKICVETGREFWELVHEDQTMEQTEVNSSHTSLTGGAVGAAFTKLLITAELEVKLHRYEEPFVTSCSETLSEAEGDKKLRKLLTKVKKQLDAERAAGRCTWGDS